MKYIKQLWHKIKFAKLTIVENQLLPTKGYVAISFLWFILVKPGTKLKESTVRHETIHYRQQLEMLFIFQWLWYLIEYLLKLLRYKSHSAAYYTISFEREAYTNAPNDKYLNERKPYAFLKYIRKPKNV